MKKLKSRRGETIIEGLVSILIVALCFGFLTTAVVTAERITSKTKAQDVAFSYAASHKEGTSYTAQVKYDTSTTTANIDYYETDNGYTYYTGVTP